MGTLTDISLRKGQPSTSLNEEDFKARYRYQFFDPKFDSLRSEIEKITDQAWQNYQGHRKAPHTIRAGAGFADPEYNLSVEWLKTRANLQQAQKEQESAVQSRVLVISGSPRNEHTCPQEISKSFRLAEYASKIFNEQQVEVDFLDLSRLTAEYGKQIHPCKACVSTAMPLCHWPCSCYPNHSLGQETDWMSEIYEKWVRAHGVMILTPVHWYGLPSPMKLMVDRLVCADGGNPDPTSTHGKNADEAKKIELQGWNYPKHLKGRAFSVVVHGDTTGIDGVRQNLTDWLLDMELIQAGNLGVLSRYIGYYKPYATSHADLDKYQDLFKDVENASLSLINQIKMNRSGNYQRPDRGLESPEQK